MYVYILIARYGGLSGYQYRGESVKNGIIDNSNVEGYGYQLEAVL
jgi:hypothetical protein